MSVSTGLSFRALCYLRVLEITGVYGRFARLSLAQIGREWGEGEWTARDLWAGS